VLDEGRVHLARAEDDTLDLVVRLDLTSFVGRVGDDPLEVRIVNKVLNARAGNGVTQERLGEEDDEG
jgi:hypothetical protein